MTNYEVEKRRLMLDIRKRQLKFLGHVIRKEGLENLIFTVRIERQGEATPDKLDYPELVDDMAVHGRSRESSPVESFER